MQTCGCARSLSDFGRRKRKSAPTWTVFAAFAVPIAELWAKKAVNGTAAVDLQPTSQSPTGSDGAMGALTKRLVVGSESYGNGFSE